MAKNHSVLLNVIYIYLYIYIYIYNYLIKDLYMLIHQIISYCDKHALVVLLL